MFKDLLAFSKNNYDLVTTVREALLQLDCPSEKLNDFDQHSAIIINFTNNISINIAVCEDRIWVWSKLHLTQNELTIHANEVFQLLTAPIEGVETNQLILGKSDQGYELKALVTPPYIENNQGLATIIEKFYENLLTLHNL
ncbi:InvB/SpaK family type III secretion system chaperone [Spartinivicinus ruber]|uniref:InvB/SpaK family type III secretion system chaperone n=1 Tax=Spartinivicinus ruber TaxID=2683272 RepID=UPI0013D49BB5|nr:hypothetical protein [Spartinivicinus ruber]